MAITDAELDDLVAETVKALREKNEKVGANIVAGIIHHSRARVLKAYDRLFEEEMTKKETESASAISPIVGAALIKDRQIYTDIKTENLTKRVEHLRCEIELLHEEIGSLQNELTAMQDQAANDRDAINGLQESNSYQQGQIQELQKQIETKMLELLTERQKYSEIFASVAELNQTLGGKTFEAQSEQTRATGLQKTIDEMAKLLKETETKRDEASLLSAHMQEKSNDLVKRLESTELQLSAERSARLNAEKEHAREKARAEVFEGQLAAMTKARADQPNAPATAARAPAAEK